MGFLDKLPMLLQIAVVAGVFAGAFVIGALFAAWRRNGSRNNSGPRDGYVTKADLLQSEIDALEERRLERHGFYTKLSEVQAELKLDIHERDDNLAEFAKSVTQQMTELNKRLGAIDVSVATLVEQARGRRRD